MSYLEHKKYKLFDGWSCVATSFIDFVNQLRQSNPTEKNLTNEEYMRNFCKRYAVSHNSAKETILSSVNEIEFVSSLLNNNLLTISLLN